MIQAGEDGRLGLIAGAGSLPIEASRLLREQGTRLFAVAFEGLTDAAIAEEVEQVRWLRLGQLESMARALHDMSVDRLLLVGKVPKALLFEGDGIAEPDEAAIRLLAEEQDRGDGPLMGAIARWLEQHRFELCDQSERLAPMLVGEGTLSARSPTEAERLDFEFGRPIAVQLGRSGVGQCVVVKQGSVLAVEAIEGTDAAIRRAGKLGGAGATVIKLSRPGQDRRFDLPAVGCGTIEALRISGASALAIEAGSTLVIDAKSMAAAADRASIAVWGFAMEREP